MGGCDLIGKPDVPGGNHNTVGGAQPVGQRLPRRRIAVEDREDGPLGQRLFHNGRADAVAAAGDLHMLARDPA